MMPGDWGDDRDARAPNTQRQPRTATEEQRAVWRALGREKFKDPAHQRFAQSHRTAESLREAGKHGYQATAERYGREFASDLLTNHRREQPTRPEREMVGLLKELGAEEGRDYQREYKVSPGMYADFARQGNRGAGESAHRDLRPRWVGGAGRHRPGPAGRARGDTGTDARNDRRRDREPAMREKTKMDTKEIIVQQLDGEAWERGEIVITGRPVTLEEWFGRLVAWEMRLSLMPLSRITGGPYDGGHVLMAVGDTRLYFAMPAAAIPALRAWLSDHDYAELLRRTPQ